VGTLYVVATPIGNLEDISARALRILGEVGLIAAEDTRTASVVLRRYEIRAPELVSYTEHNRGRRIPHIVERLATTDVALVSDAGTPAVSDPGIELVAAARAAGYEVVAVAGPSAVAAAVSVSGLRVATFRFAGFLPRGKTHLRAVISEQTSRTDALVAFESPNRLRETLAAIEETLPDTRIAVCRELTKLHEETFVGTATEALAHFTEPRGEIVLVIEGADPNAKAPPADDTAVRAEIAAMRRVGLTQSQASALLSDRYALPRRKLYELWLAEEPD
jgi:16S rRNA (cytidine1402-2'-O)-methyltransferase